ncbi:uncharacterized protein LOC110433001 [Sorghum bicolor]|nr:uncharacterized protein LOC110433001 [Sorghum bicolor]|eukprot:XP_021310125.1 uncharacterized protein LOC110433001 [Sorghum bicolor]
MGRSSEEGSRSRRMKSEAAEAKKVSSEEGSLRPRTRSMKSEAKKAPPEEGTRRRTRSMKSEAAEAKMASSSEVFRILKLESEEDRKILMKVKSEEGMILKLKKEYVAAMEGRPVRPTVVPKVTAAQPAGKKTKKVLVKKLRMMTKAQIDFIRAMATQPCATSNLTEDQLAEYPESFQCSMRQSILVRHTRLAYMEALIDQQEKFGYAVDESETEVTDDEGDAVVEVENY